MSCIFRLFQNNFTDVFKLYDFVLFYVKYFIVSSLKHFFLLFLVSAQVEKKKFITILVKHSIEDLSSLGNVKSH